MIAPKMTGVGVPWGICVHLHLHLHLGTLINTKIITNTYTSYTKMPNTSNLGVLGVVLAVE